MKVILGLLFLTLLGGLIASASPTQGNLQYIAYSVDLQGNNNSVNMVINATSYPVGNQYNNTIYVTIQANINGTSNEFSTSHSYVSNYSLVKNVTVNGLNTLLNRTFSYLKDFTGKYANVTINVKYQPMGQTQVQVNGQNYVANVYGLNAQVTVVFNTADSPISNKLQSAGSINAVVHGTAYTLTYGTLYNVQGTAKVTNSINYNFGGQTATISKDYSYSLQVQLLGTNALQPGSMSNTSSSSMMSDASIPLFIGIVATIGYVLGTRKI